MTLNAALYSDKMPISRFALLILRNEWIFFEAVWVIKITSARAARDAAALVPQRDVAKQARMKIYCAAGGAGKRAALQIDPGVRPLALALNLTWHGVEGKSFSARNDFSFHHHWQRSATQRPINRRKMLRCRGRSCTHFTRGTFSEFLFIYIYILFIFLEILKPFLLQA